MPTTVTPFLMFTGQAEEAARWYVSLLPDSRIANLMHHGPDGPGEEGKVLQAEVVLAGQRVRFFDSAPVHDFTFTPSISLFVDCADEAELDRLAAALGEGGRELMPLGAYGFSQKYAWLNDRFGVSWQLNLPFVS